MKFTLSWLKQHLATDADLDAVTAKLTAVGLEVEEVSDRGQALAAFTVGYVISAEPHPNADRLRVCLVDTGRGEVQVVCGAPNARAGMKGVFAPSGTTIPGSGLHLKPTSIRGVDSNGMLCSDREMGLSDEHEGIIELPDDAEVGAPFATVAGLDDPLIEIGITPNRQDCLGVHGIARDLAAAGLGTLRALDESPVPGTGKSPIDVILDFPAAAAEACPMFVGRYLQGVKNGPSPAWLQAKLKAIGLRPISSLVDITNYVTFNLGRPLHVFDADTVKGDLRVHLGAGGAKLLALDGNSYELDDEVCAISDANGVQSLGGIMGGEATGCTAATSNVFIEAALFDPIRTAASGRRLGILSDARYRFERGVDPSFVSRGMEIATRLVMELCGGRPSDLVVSGAEPDWRRTVSFRPARVKALTGVELPEATMIGILEKLGFSTVWQDACYAVAVPPWRSDVGGEADLVEDIVRIHGYDKIPSATLPRAHGVAAPTLTAVQKHVRTAKRVLAARGLNEAVTWSFVARRHAIMFGGGADELVLDNPISADLDTMRPSVLPHLIAAAGRNADRGNANAALFEVGPQYAGDQPCDQARVAAGVRSGSAGERHWSAAVRPIDLFDAKADAMAVLAACGAQMRSLQIESPGPSWYHPGRSGVVRLGPKNCLAAFGELHPGVLAALGVAGPVVGTVVGFEVYLDNLPKPRAKATTRPPLEVSDKPAVQRDFAFLVDEAVSADRVIRAALSADRELVAEVQLFDVYQGEALGPGRKSLAIAVRLEPKERTLTDAEIEAVAGRIVAKVEKATGAVLRGAS